MRERVSTTASFRRITTMGWFDRLRRSPRKPVLELLAEARTLAASSRWDEALHVFEQVPRRDLT
jgi:hypothetical protein